MSSVEDLAAKVRDRQSNNGSEDHDGQKEVLQQIQNMFDKQTQDIVTFILDTK